MRGSLKRTKIRNRSTRGVIQGKRLKELDMRKETKVVRADEGINKPFKEGAKKEIFPTFRPYKRSSLHRMKDSPLRDAESNNLIHVVWGRGPHSSQA